jgi:hypothetical protein
MNKKSNNGGFHYVTDSDMFLIDKMLYLVLLNIF